MTFQTPNSDFGSQPMIGYSLTLNEFDRAMLEASAGSLALTLSNPLTAPPPNETQAAIEEAGRALHGKQSGDRGVHAAQAVVSERHYGAATQEAEKAQQRRLRAEAQKSITTNDKETSAPIFKHLMFLVAAAILVFDNFAIVRIAASYVSASQRLPDYAGNVLASIWLCGFSVLVLIGFKLFHALIVTEQGKRRYAMAIMVAGLSIVVVSLIPLFGYIFNPYWLQVADNITDVASVSQINIGLGVATALVTTHLLGSAVLGGGIAIMVERAAYEHKKTKTIKSDYWTTLDDHARDLEQREQLIAHGAARARSLFAHHEATEKAFLTLFRGRVAYYLDRIAAARAREAEQFINPRIDDLSMVDVATSPSIVADTISTQH